MDEEPAAASQLITASALIARLGEPKLRIVDARFELTEPRAGAEMYARGHVPGAVHLDLDRDLAAPAKRGEGRHPLPDMTAFARSLGELGIGRRTPVVVYDQTGTMYAARAWWLLRYAGHEDVRFVDGGFAAYLAAGGPVSTEIPAIPPTSFELN
ncbi:MAG TPA: rhodanese-like domain-containing protein, partial [Trueperaceae bacterium]|nr:rhodanese-like domain-containing protein [Trueperaceae bacterium]